MNKWISVLLAAVIMVPSFCCASGVPQDKIQHIGACYAAELTLSQVKPFRKWKSWQRFLFTVGIIGGAKEWYDARHPGSHSADWGDIAADAVGAAAGEGFLWIVRKEW